MKRIIAIITIAGLIGLTPINSAGQSSGPLVPFYIYNAASQFNIDAALLYAFCQVESRCNPNAINRNDGTPEEKAAGIKVKSYGLFQIKASTAQSLGFIVKRVIQEVKYNKRGKQYVVKKTLDFSNDLRKPEVNSYYAAKLIHKLYQKYGDNTLKVISAYNAGHAIKGNQDYVSKVAKEYLKLKIDRKI